MKLKQGTPRRRKSWNVGPESGQPGTDTQETAATHCRGGRGRVLSLPLGGLIEVSRGDWTALELFRQGIAEWDDAVKRLVMAA